MSPPGKLSVSPMCTRCYQILVKRGGGRGWGSSYIDAFHKKKSLLAHWSECEKGLSVTLGSVSNQTIFLHSVIDSMVENKVKG